MAEGLLLLPEGWPRLLLIFVAALPLVLIMLRKNSGGDTAIPAPAAEGDPRLLRARPFRLPCRSLVIVAHNEALRLPALLADLKALLEHEGEKLEILLVDDRSSDSTGEMMDAFANEHLLARVLRFPEEKGKAACLKRAVSECKGSQILFSDADCRIKPGWAQAMGEALDSGWDLVGGPVLLAEYAPVSRWQRLNWLLLSGMGLRSTEIGHTQSLWGANMAFCREAVEKAGGYASLANVNHNEDLVFTRSMIRAGGKVGMFAPDEDWIVRTAACDDRSLARQLARWLSGLARLELSGKFLLLAGLAWFPALLILGAMRPLLFVVLASAMLFSMHTLLGHFARRLGQKAPSTGDSMIYLLGWPPLMASVLFQFVSRNPFSAWRHGK